MKHGYKAVTGTSFASPIIAARFAILMARPDAGEAKRAWRALERAAIDLGAPGHDPVFGYGYLGSPRAALAARAQATN